MLLGQRCHIPPGPRGPLSVTTTGVLFVASSALMASHTSVLKTSPQVDTLAFPSCSSTGKLLPSFLAHSYGTLQRSLVRAPQNGPSGWPSLCGLSSRAGSHQGSPSSPPWGRGSGDDNLSAAGLTLPWAPQPAKWGRDGKGLWSLRVFVTPNHIVYSRKQFYKIHLKDQHLQSFTLCWGEKGNQTYKGKCFIIEFQKQSLIEC